MTSRKREATEQEEAADDPGMAPPRDERERRLWELRLKMTQCRSANNKEVVDEQRRFTDPNYAKKKAADDQEKRQERNRKEGGDDGDMGKQGSGEPAAKVSDVPKGKEYMLDTVEHAETRAAKKKRGDPDAFGWDVFNQDSLYRAHDKRLKNMKFDEKAYSRQEQQEAVDQPLFAGFGHQATDEQKDRLQQAVDAMATKKKDYSRRRTHVDEGDVSYVNDRNRHFNQKMDRFFGSYTAEIKQNLERGTAL